MICKCCKKHKVTEYADKAVVFCPDCGWFRVNEDGEWTPTEKPIEEKPEPIKEPVQAESEKPIDEENEEALADGVIHIARSVRRRKVDFAVNVIMLVGMCVLFAGVWLWRRSQLIKPFKVSVIMSGR
jgi:hypothetical protein